MQDSIQPDMLLTVKDVAELLSIGVRTVWRWTNTRRLPQPIQLSEKCSRWKASEIQAYIDRCPTPIESN